MSRSRAGERREDLHRVDTVGQFGCDRRLVPRARADLENGLGGLGVTALLQLVVALASGSVALLADTVHNVSDAVTAVPLAVAFWIGRRPPNQRYTHGYGRAEDLAGIFILAMISLSCAITAWQASGRLLHRQEVHHLGWVATAGLIGFAGNELVAVYRIRVGRRMGSAALVADGLHARTDGLSSLAVVGGAVGVAAGLPLADPIVGLLITIAILFVLQDAARAIFRRLMDGVEPSMVDRVHDIVGTVAGIKAIDRVCLRWVGHELHALIDVVSDCDLTIAQAHDIAEEAHHRLLHEVPHLARASIHTSPCSHDGPRPPCRHRAPFRRPVRVARGARTHPRRWNLRPTVPIRCSRSEGWSRDWSILRGPLNKATRARPTPGSNSTRRCARACVTCGSGPRSSC